MWLSYLRLFVPAGLLTYDLAVDAHGTGRPSPVAAGLPSVPIPHSSPTTTRTVVLAALAFLAAFAVLAGGGMVARRTRARAA